MSFEVYLQSYESGVLSGIPAGPVHALFPESEYDAKWEVWNIRYGPQDSCVIRMGTPEHPVTELSVERPCSDMRLWEALWAFMNLGNVAFFFPSDPPVLAAANASMEKHFPPDMMQAFGQLRVVSSAGELVELVRSS
jgi:hypothetical protein